MQDEFVDRQTWTSDEIISRLRLLEEDLKVKGRDYTKQKQKFESGNEASIKYDAHVLFMHTHTYIHAHIYIHTYQSAHHTHWISSAILAVYESRDSYICRLFSISLLN